MHFTHSSHGLTHQAISQTGYKVLLNPFIIQPILFLIIKNICNSSQNLFLFLKFNIYKYLSCVKISSRQELLVRPRKQILCKIKLSPVKWLCWKSLFTALTNVIRRHTQKTKVQFYAWISVMECIARIECSWVKLKVLSFSRNKIPNVCFHVYLCTTFEWSMSGRVLMGNWGLSYPWICSFICPIWP